MLCLSLSAPLVAQTFNQKSTYFALIRTAVAGLPPIATSTILGDLQEGVALAIRYGYVPSGMSFPLHNNVGATAVLPVGTASTVSITGGISSASQGGSDAWVVDLGGDMRLTDVPFHQGRSAPHLRIGLNGELGYAKPRESGLIAGSIGLPLRSFGRIGPSSDAGRSFRHPGFLIRRFLPERRVNLPKRAGRIS